MEQIDNQPPSSILYRLSTSSESFESSQTIYNSYYYNYDHEMIIEAVTLSTAAPQKPKNMEEFAKMQTYSGKRDLSILTTAAVEIGHKLNASAIITFSEETLKIPSCIPFLVFTPRKSTRINELTRYIEENNNNIYDKVETRARSASKDMSVQKGLGGRHTSAAAITRDTETIAVTVSSSGGTIRIFKDGLELLKIEPDIMLVQ